MRHLRGKITAIAGVIVLLLVAGIWVALTQPSAQSSASTTRDSAPSGAKASPSSQVPSGPLQLLSETPASNATGVSGLTDIKLQFSAPLASNSPLPKIKPKVAGSWQGAGTSTLEFVPGRGFGQRTRVRVT